MGIMSKYDVEYCLRDYRCSEIMHPWNESCILASLSMATGAIKGSIKYFLLMYGVQLFFKVRAKKKINFNKELLGFSRSIAVVTVYGIIFVSGQCFFRNLLGMFNYYALLFAVPTICGLPIFFDNPSRTDVVCTTFITMALEGVYRSIQNNNYIKRQIGLETLVFILMNGLLMCSLRTRKRFGGQLENLWFFSPSKQREDKFERHTSQCSHEGTCRRSFTKEVLKFGSIAMLISFAKAVVKTAKTPSRFLRVFMKWNNMKLPAFVIAYIGMFKATSCYLTKKEGDTLRNTFIAGLLAGTSYIINPNITILFSIVTAMLKVTGKFIKQNQDIPNLPYLQICFVISNMYLCYLLMLDGKSCPRFFVNTIHTCSVQKSKMILEQFHKAVEKYKQFR